MSGEGEPITYYPSATPERTASALAASQAEYHYAEYERARVELDAHLHSSKAAEGMPEALRILESTSRTTVTATMVFHEAAAARYEHAIAAIRELGVGQ